MALSIQPTTQQLPQLDQQDVLVGVVNRVMVITLNRPKALNALTIPMLRTIYEALKDVRDNRSADLVIIKSSSEKSFCSGGDVLEIRKSFLTNGTTHKMFYVLEYIVDFFIGTLEVPFVAFVHGIAMGAGCGISVNGSFRVCTENSMLAMPECGVGLFPDAGATYLLPRLPNNLGIFIALTGHRLKGADAYHSGMATHYVSSTKLAELEQQLLALQSPTFQSVEHLLNTFHNSQKIPEFTLAKDLEELNQVFGQSKLETLVGELKRSETEFAKKQLEAINKMSPISLKVTFHQLQLGKHMKFAEVFASEYRLIQKLVSNPNFLEGCRALLIEKDHNPKWVPSKIEEVTEQDVQNHYELLPNEFDLNAKI